MKKFINKQVMDFKFRKAGEGHRLDEEKPRPSSGRAASSASSSDRRRVLSGSSAAAGQAAIARLEGATPTREKTTPRESSEVQEKRSKVGSTREEAVVAGASVVAPSVGNVTVMLVCPICRRSVPYSDVNSHLMSCLQEEYMKEPLSVSVQMIHTLCPDTTKRKACIETITKYLDNIIDHPGEEKYHKIRIGNKTFSEKVLPVVGADLFLEAIGFQQRLLPHQDSEEQFYVLTPSTDGETSNPESESQSGHGLGGASSIEEQLSVYKELLVSSEPLRLELDRQVTLFQPSPHVTNFDLSADFYQLSLEEIRKEQKLKSEAVERSQQLRTKAMRERDEMRAVTKYYRYTLVRVRLPEGLFLQAAFRPLEKLQAVREMVCESLTDPTLTFSLSAFGQLLKSDSDTLAQLGLVPSAVLNLSWNGSGPHSGQPYLEPGLLEKIQRL